MFNVLFLFEILWEPSASPVPGLLFNSFRDKPTNLAKDYLVGSVLDLDQVRLS